MPYQYTYILVNFFTIIICFIASFHKKIQFSSYFKYYLLSSTLIAIPFILWDMYFTRIGVWWFDKQYTLGYSIGNLPLEEILFFFCIPFSCVFTFYCFDKFYNWSWSKGLNNLIIFPSLIILIVVGLLTTDKIYTCVTAWVNVGTLIYLYFIRREQWIAQASIIFTILMLGFFPVNGILTGSGLPSPIVNYNSDAILNIRIGTIPIEDAVYGYAQFLWNVFMFKVITKNKISHGI